jgi:hypothetical protein
MENKVEKIINKINKRYCDTYHNSVMIVNPENKWNVIAHFFPMFSNDCMQKR